MYDVIILGAGPGGYLLAEKLGKKMKTAIIEKQWFGGTCLNVGCIPSKALLYSRKVYSNIKHSDQYGISVKGYEYNHEQVIKRKDEKVKFLVDAVEANVKANRVSIFKGEGKIIKKDAQGFHVEVNGEILIGKKLVIATGSTTSNPPIKGLEERLSNKEKILTNIEILSMKKLPNNLLIIGGGVIGLEMAAYFHNLVKELNVVEFQDHIAGPTDLEISSELLKYYQNKNINFHLSSAVVEIKDDVVIVKDLKTNKLKEIKYEKLLLAAGRKPNIDNIGIEKINVFTDKGAIVTNNNCKTNIANVFAIGDVNGKSMLAHTAYREAEVVYSQLTGDTWDIVDYGAIPSVIYTTPEVAAVGKSEEELKEQGIEYIARKAPMIYSGRFVAEVDDYNGLVKILISKVTNEILGVHIIGSYASEVISTAGIMVAKRMTIDIVKDIVLPHPTVAEILKNLITMEDK